MKKTTLAIVFMFIAVSAFAEDKPIFCKDLDKDFNFVRCETNEVVCYELGKSFAQCWPKLAPPAQVPAPVASAAPSKSKK